MKITEDVKECIRRLFSAFVREKQRRAPEYSYEHPIFRIAAALQLPRPTVYGIVSQSGTGCNSVILLRPKIGVEPPKHDVISMPTQQYTNTNYISLERSHLVVSIMLRYVDRIKNIQWQFELPRSENRQKILGWLYSYFSSQMRTSFYKYSDNKRSAQMKRIS